MITYTIGKFDAGGYYVVMEAGIGLCHTKSLNTAKRIILALAYAVSDVTHRRVDVVGFGVNYVDSDGLVHVKAVFGNIVELKPAVVEDW